MQILIDEVPYFILKKCVDVISPVIVYLFNLSISSGVVPNSLITARVRAFFKSGDRKDRKIIGLFLVFRFIAMFLRETFTK